MIVLGIDPGASTGLACYGPEGLYYARTYPYGDDGAAVLDQLRALVALGRTDTGNGEILAVVEEPAKAFFERRVSRRANYRIAGNVGECRAKAHALAGMLRAMGVEVEMRKPLKGGTKRKINLDTWKLMFPEFKGRTSNHARDAAVLARKVWQERHLLAGQGGSDANS